MHRTTYFVYFLLPLYLHFVVLSKPALPPFLLIYINLAISLLVPISIYAAQEPRYLIGFAIPIHYYSGTT
jgi:hypothetical protein